MRTPEPTVAAAYALLGVALDADREAVTRAYHRLARDNHPDLSDAPDAAARFDAVTAAYRCALKVAASGRTPHPAERAANRRESPGYLVRASHAGGLRPIFAVGPARVDPLPPRRRVGKDGA